MKKVKTMFGLFLVGLIVFAVAASGCIGGEKTTTPTGTQTMPTQSTTPAKIVWVSTQLAPPEERAFVKETLLANFKKQYGIDVDFIPMSYTDLSTRLAGEEKTGKVTIDVIGDLHGGLDYFNSQGWLMDLSKMPKLEGRTFITSFEKYATINGKKVYVPWMSATYVMVVNKKAFDYLPAGLTKDDVIKGTDKWTYDAFLAWAKNLYEKTGKPQVGFPAGPNGLFVRFLHGYLYPSFTGYEAKAFDSPEAVTMWNYLKELWKYVNPASTTWDAMSDPLLTGQVLIAWDHTARIKNAIQTKPDEFVVVPVPRGPKGRGFIVVLAGLAIPKGAPNPDAAWKLIDYLTKPETQVEVLKNVGFFPTVKEATNAIPEGPLKILAEGVTAQSSTPDALIVMIPNLGDKGGEFKNIYKEAFRRIVLQGEDPQKVISELGPKLLQLFKEKGIEVP
ncbi:ABC transporter substrate-binding protein [Thermococcus barophilus]|uniref:Motif prokaryotic membrane lipoprotein lipid attachment site n=1 Tax=Thermococcus barophilus TaxID=55802 RepID=A0A0S1XE80_THEBA|nr:ABC transporter substrate-binding protein [Thermococcus barophilus]ALM76040.1 Motif prokaryotic membrane lipoprotein lipid attachment site [Thermococcus barophilus]